MRKRYILIFLTLVLLLVPSISTLADPDNEPTDDSSFPEVNSESSTGSSSSTIGSITDPPSNLKKGDIVLLRWSNREGVLRFVYWSHAMICSNPSWWDPYFYQAWHGVESRSWYQIMNDIQEDKGNLINRAVLRLRTPYYRNSYINNALWFIESKFGAPYDCWSQEVSYHPPHKQVKPNPDSWWYQKLPPSGYVGPYNDPDVWVENFSYNERVRYQWYENGQWHHRWVYPAQEYYCTELVWAAYFQGSQGNLYLEYTPDLGAIRGMEFYLDLLHFKRVHTWNPWDVHPGPYDEC